MNREKGGLACHPINYIVADDEGDPSRHQALVQQLVEQDHVMAFVFMDSEITGQSSVSYLTQKQIPVVGSAGAGTWFYQSPVYFAEVPSGLGVAEDFYAATADVAHQLNKPKVGFMACVELSACSIVVDHASEGGQKYGYDSVYTAKVSVAQPDYSANCQAAKQAGVEVLALALDTNSDERVARSCNSVQFNPVYVGSNQGLAPSLATDPLLNNAFVTMNVLPAVGSSNPGVAEFLDVMKRYTPGTFPLGTAELGWISAKLFAQGMANLPDEPTSQTMLRRLWSIGTTDLGGMTASLTFVPNQNPPPTQICHWLLQIRGGQFTNPYGDQRKCP